MLDNVGIEMCTEECQHRSGPVKPPGDNQGNYQKDDREFAFDFLTQPVKLPRGPEPEMKDIKISEAKSEEELHV